MNNPPNHRTSADNKGKNFLANKKTAYYEYTIAIPTGLELLPA
jgi:hypothetical protein